MNYILMNKDFAWLSFSCRRNEFDEAECSEHEWHTELRPWGYHNLTYCLTGRQATKPRKCALFTSVEAGLAKAHDLLTARGMLTDA